MAVTTSFSFGSVGEALVADWQGAGLLKASVLKSVFTTIEEGLVVRASWGVY